MSERVIRVQPSELDSQASRIGTEKGSFTVSYTDICNEATRLTTTSWGGVDAESFKAKMDEFKKDFQQMESILEQYIQFLNKSATAYRTAQDDVNNQINTLSTKIK